MPITDNPFVAVPRKGKSKPSDLPTVYGTRPEMSSGDKVRAIAANRERNDEARGDTPSSQFPQRARGGFSRATDVITGSGRETRATRELPELGVGIGIGEFLGEDASALGKIVASINDATTFDEGELVDILQSASRVPIGVQSDEAGNVILSRGDRIAVLNRPGLSGRDIKQMVANAALFYGPAAATTKPLAVGAGEALIQGGIEGVQSASGGSFDASNVAVAGLAGAAMQKIANVLAARFPSVFGSTKPLDDASREQVRREAIRLGASPDDLTDDAIDRMVARSRVSASPSRDMAIAGEREFDIPLTAGQRSMDDAALSWEDRARAGQFGAGPQRPLREFQTQTQEPAINAAVERQRAALGGPGTQNRGGAGDVVIDSVRRAERAAADAVSEAYSPDNIGSAELTLDGVNRLLNATRKAVIGIDKDRGQPGTASLLAVIRDTQSVLNKVKGAKDIPWERLEILRRRINAQIGTAANPTDKAQMVQMKRAFDDYIDQAVIDGLFKGDAGVIDNLKSARGIFSKYASLFRQQSKKTKSGRALPDDAGRFIERIVEADPTAEEVVNMLLGVDGFNKTGSVALVRRMRDITGAESDAIGAIREEAFRRIIRTTNVNGQPVVSGSQSITALQKALERNGTLMRELFTPEEIGTMQRLLMQIKRTQPDLPKSSGNPSGSGIVAVRGLVEFIGDVFGLPVRIVSGGLDGSFAVGRSAKARSAIRPFTYTSQPGLVTRAATGAGVAAGVPVGTAAVGEVPQVQGREQQR